MRTNPEHQRHTRRGRRLVLCCAIALGLLSVGGVAYAAFVATTSNSGNTISAASSFGRCGVDQINADNPQAYWRLDETSGSTLNSETSSGNGSFSGTPTLNQAGAYGDPANRAVKFNGTNQSATTGSFASNDTFTIEAWVKRSNLGSANTIFTRGNNGPGIGFDTGNHLVLTKEGSGSLVNTSTTAITDTTSFHHVVVTKSGSTTKLYIDGVDRTGTGINATMSSVTQVARIAYNGSSYWFGGTIDELAYYPTVLTPARVLAHYQSGRCYRDEPRADNAQAQWRLGEPTGTATAFDSLSTNNGIFTSIGSNGPTAGSPGVIYNDSNTAVSFDGQDDVVDLGDRFDFPGSQAFTAEAWVKPGAKTTGSRRIFDKSYFGTASQGWTLQINASTQAFRIDRRSDTGVYDFAEGTTPTVADQWYYVVGTYDGTNLRLYVNGVLEKTSAAVTTTAADTPAHLGIGGIVGSQGTNFFQGTIQDAAVYNAALSAQRVEDHYIAGRAYRDIVLDDAPSEFLPLDDSSSSVATAAVGTNGTYTASPTHNFGGPVAGDPSAAVTLNGSSQYTQVANSSATNAPTNAGATYEIWARRTSTAGSFNNLFYRQGAVELAYDNSATKIGVWIGASGGTLIATAPAPTDMNWHHIVFTKAGNTSKIYIDGTDQTTNLTTATIPTVTTIMTLGSYLNSDWFAGDQADAALYSRALTAAEVKLHYDAGIRTPR